MAIEQRETTSLIGSDKVEGTAVYGSDEKRIGSVDRIMIDKRSGKVAYAVLSYGGFLGIGDDHYPTPWSTPKYGNDNEWGWSRAEDERVYGFYKAAPYW